MHSSVRLAPDSAGAGPSAPHRQQRAAIKYCILWQELQNNTATDDVTEGTLGWGMKNREKGRKTKGLSRQTKMEIDRQALRKLSFFEGDKIIFSINIINKIFRLQI